MSLSQSFIQKLTDSLPDAVKGADKIAVAFSGGADSLALLTALAAIYRSKGIRIKALHCNFHLRGDESDADTEFCIEAAKKANAEIEIKHFYDTKKIAAESGVSIEMTCRDLRYEWFKEYTDNGYYIGIGHHLEDNRETMFLNLMRGTGIKGLTGMSVFDSVRKIFRPMLSISRKEIEDFLQEQRLAWRTDSSNLIADVQRNKIRLNIFPEICKNFPSGMQGIDTTMENLRRDYELFTEYLDLIIGEIGQSDRSHIDIKKLKNLTARPTIVLFRILRPLGFNFNQCEEILNIVEGVGYKTFISGEHTVYTDGGKIIIKTESNRTSENNIIQAETLEELCEKVEGLSCSIINFKEFEDTILNNRVLPDTVFFDETVLQSGTGKTFKWRRIEKGDKMQPFGMNGRRKLISDILTDLHASPVDKDNTMVLVSPNNEILWLAPIRASNLHKVTKKSKRIIRLKYSQ